MKAANCTFGGGCGDAAAPAPSADLLAKARNHPCYSEEAHHHFARMHVAVAPACNIQCNYCNRKYDCANESRPGVVSERLTPAEAVRKVLAVAAEVPQLSVVASPVPAIRSRTPSGPSRPSPASGAPRPTSRSASPRTGSRCPITWRPSPRWGSATSP